MNREKRKYNRLQVGTEHMNAQERAAMEAAYWAALHIQKGSERRKMMDRITDIGAARGRAEQCRESNARTDARRRKLVGARVPKEFAQRCKRCADAKGISLYRFVCNALERECGETEPCQ